MLVINKYINKKKNLCAHLAGYVTLLVNFSCFISLLQSNASLSSGLLAHYRSLVEQGKLQHDPYQEKIASELENLLQRLEQYEKDMEEYHVRVSYCDNELFIEVIYSVLFQRLYFKFHAFRQNLHNGRIIGKIGGVSF